MTEISRRSVLAAGAGFGAMPLSHARAQAANTIKIALLCDFSGTYRDVTGPNELACVRQAAAEFANRGFNIEVVYADNQNRADVGSNVTRAWFDRDGVDVVVDGGASSVALAVNDVVRDKNKVFLNSSSATSDLTGRACSPNLVHWTYDTFMLAKSTGGANTTSSPNFSRVGTAVQEPFHSRADLPLMKSAAGSAPFFTTFDSAAA